MTNELLNSVLNVLKSHPSVLSGDFSSNCRGIINIEINVEMPLKYKGNGKSPNGVRILEPVSVNFPKEYPWKSPKFYLRKDFPSNLPHLLPLGKSNLPQPCLVDSHTDEYFFQFSSHEVGVLKLLDQLVIWLEKAAMNCLNNPKQGWEPILRVGISSCLILDSNFCRKLVNRNGGKKILQGRFTYKKKDYNPNYLLETNSEQVPLPKAKINLFENKNRENFYIGDTVVAIIFPPKLPTGQLRIENEYHSENIKTIADLKKLADDFGCGEYFNQLLKDLKRYVLRKYSFNSTIPVGVVFCVHRPFKLERRQTNIELIPYVFEIISNPNLPSAIKNSGNWNVFQAAQFETISKDLLMTVSGLNNLPSISLLGCGSVGSKIGLHLARAGAKITGLCDKEYFSPHNMARHALIRSGIGEQKAIELKKDLEILKQEPKVFLEDLISGFAIDSERKQIIPPKTNLLINTTASLGVREAICKWGQKFKNTRVAEIGLFGQGNAGFLLLCGKNGNPNLSDLMAVFYSKILEDRAFELLHNDQYGLSEIQIGQGCHSTSMKMSDIRLSAMTSILTEELLNLYKKDQNAGRIVFGYKNKDDGLNTNWLTYGVPELKIIPIEGFDGWHVRLSRECEDYINKEIRIYPKVETGGVIIGVCNTRQKIISVVDTIPAPCDSSRTSSKFVLGNKGLEIQKRLKQSGNTLIDLGTWHSHLRDSKPSKLDWTTATKLSQERSIPYILLVFTPNKIYAISKSSYE